MGSAVSVRCNMINRNPGNRRSIWLCFIALVMIGQVATVIAGPMTRNVESVLPRIGQQGTTVEVRIQGVSLADPRQIIFFKPGIRAVDIRPAPEPPPRVGLMHGAWISEEVRCRFVIAADCPPGEHFFRVLTATELTNVGTFHVSPFAVIDEEEGGSYANDTIEKAKPVALDVTVRGTISEWSKGDRDLYRVTCRAGQRLSVQVDSAKIANKHYGDSEFDLALRILDEDGKVLAANDDNSIHLQDPYLSLKVPKDGDLIVEVSRSVFSPHRTNYCVHMGDYCRPMAVFPPGGKALSQQRVQLLGDPLGTTTATIAIGVENQADERLDRGNVPTSSWFQYDAGGPSPIRLRSSPYANTVEDTKANINKVDSIPTALNGVIDSPTDRDTWKIAARKGERLRLRVFASSLGSPIDAAIRIRPLNDDSTTGPLELEKDDSPIQDHDIHGAGFRGGGGLLEAIDPSVIWTPKADGDYLLEIVDLSGQGGPTGVYRIEIERPLALVQTYLRSRTNDWTESMRVSGMIVPRGNRWTINLSLTNGQGNWPRSEFDLVAHGLPRGMRLLPTRIKPGTTLWPIQFEADPDAETSGSVITLDARPTDKSERVATSCQQNVPFINHSGGDAWRTVRMDRYIAAVTEPAPFSIEVEQPDIALVRGGELSIPVRVVRHGDFKDAVELRSGFAPSSVSVPPPLIIPPDENTGVLQLGARSNAPLETVPFVVLGDTVREDIQGYLGVGHIRVSSKIVQLQIAEPYVELTARPESIRRGEEKKYVWTVRHHQSFADKATVKLLGLPKGVSVIEPQPSLTGDSKEIAFSLKATDIALLGQAKGLICEVSVPVGNQIIVQRTGRGTLRIDPAVQ